jgi:hypothetical protein
MKGYRRVRQKVFSSAKGDFSLKSYDEHKCIFVHITKTAGTSVAKSLFGYLPYHYTAVDYRAIYGKKTFNEYYKFAFVRNPWDRLYSAYRYLKAGGWNDEDKQWAETHLSRFSSFNEFVRHWLTKENINKHKHFWPQRRFICDSRNRLLIDYLAYFETLHEDYDVIKSRLQIDTEIGRHNVNPGETYKEAYDYKSKMIVADVYSEDIALFGYDFDGIRERKVIHPSTT